MRGTYSPLRYPGGKGKLIEYFKQLFETNELNGGVYIEPYAGGASVALALLIDGYASSIIINDGDKALHSFWYCVLYRTEELCKRISETKVTMTEWHRQKAVQRNKEHADILDLAFSTFFLNRTNRSGILKAGVIGGLEQKSKWKMDARYNKEVLIEKIKLISQYKNQITLYGEDAVSLLRRIHRHLPKKSLIYLDPPYYHKGKELYLNFYTEENHVDIADIIRKINVQKWIITYDEAELIRKLYSGCPVIEYELTYTAGKARRGKELVIHSRNLKATAPILPCSK